MSGHKHERVLHICYCTERSTVFHGSRTNNFEIVLHFIKWIWNFRTFQVRSNVKYLHFCYCTVRTFIKWGFRNPSLLVVFLDALTVSSLQSFFHFSIDPVPSIWYLPINMPVIIHRTIIVTITASQCSIPKGKGATDLNVPVNWFSFLWAARLMVDVHHYWTLLSVMACANKHPHTRAYLHWGGIV